MERSAGRGLSTEALLLIAGLWWLATANLALWRSVSADRSLADPATWAWLGALGTIVLALHLLLLLPLAHRRIVKPAIALLTLVAAAAAHFQQRLGTVLDPLMLRNALQTDWSEARELIGLPLIGHLVWTAGPLLLLLCLVPLKPPPPWRRAATLRVGMAAAAALALLLAVFCIFQPLAAAVRNDRQLRYRVTPAAPLWSAGVALAGEASFAGRALESIGLDARQVAEGDARPRVLVLVVGETVRADRWGFAGPGRETTPLLNARSLLTAPSVQACGTDTATSLPCMFAPVGRRDYDGARIRRSESLLHVVARAGVQVHWRDNQSGCKGVCTGLSQDRVIDLNPPGLCEGGRHGHCFDEGLLHGLPERLAKAQGTQLLVLHMLGNHGPAYFRRYPKSFGIFQPACERDDLQRCTPAEIANAYDNALRYTDHVLARLIGMLEASKMDTAMIYVADHGESLGENGLWLHGLPYAIAPEAQKRVPMVMWSSPGFAGRIGLGLDCLGRRMQQPVAHDHLFHSLLGLLQVQTALYEPTLDLSGECRPGRVH